MPPLADHWKLSHYKIPAEEVTLSIMFPWGFNLDHRTKQFNSIRVPFYLYLLYLLFYYFEDDVHYLFIFLSGFTFLTESALHSIHRGSSVTLDSVMDEWKMGLLWVNQPLDSVVGEWTTRLCLCLEVAVVSCV